MNDQPIDWYAHPDEQHHVTADRDGALATALKENAHLQLALERRTMIGQACGILIERHTITADQAFAALVRVSSARNVKIYHLAEELLATGQIEGLKAPEETPREEPSDNQG